MDYSGDLNFTGDVGPVIKEIQTISSDDWTSPSNDQSMWATEEDYQAWNADLDFFPSSAMDGRQPHKRPRNFTGDSGSSVVKELQPSRSKAIGRMFFKTKLCCKFRQGTCPYVTNCNFAHGIEELRNPPPNWQEIMAAQDDDRAQMSDQREENQIPILNSTNLGGEQRSYKGRHCKKFYTDEGCPYGDMCTFLHDEQSKARESVAISLGPTMANSYGSGSIGGNGSNQKPSNWKTRICNKWETTGYCPFGNKCHFAHGLGELHKYGGGLVETNSRDPSLTSGDTNQGGSLPRAPDGHASQTPVLHAEVSSIGLAAQRSTSINQWIGPPKPVQKWKGPDKISRIYGDWIDDIE